MVSGGVVVNGQLDAGGEIFWASTTFDAGDYRAAFLLGVVQFRPWQTRGFYLKGGLGLAFIRANITVDDQTTTSTPKGLGVHYGAGWMFGSRAPRLVRAVRRPLRRIARRPPDIRR